MAALHSDFKAKLAAHGVAAPEQLATVQKLKALGFGNGEILKWLADHKSEILAIAELILSKSQPPVPAA